MRDRRKKFEEMIEFFTQKAQAIEGVQEIVLMGSMLTDTASPGDVDQGVFVSNFDCVGRLARAARRMSRFSSYWDVMVYTISREFLGYICQRKDCPTMSVDCTVSECGEIPHIARYTKRVFSEVQAFGIRPRVLFAKGPSLALAWHEDLVRRAQETGTELPQVREDIVISCRECGEDFLWSASEQRKYGLAGWERPKKCRECRPARCWICGERIGVTRREAKGASRDLCFMCSGTMEEMESDFMDEDLFGDDFDFEEGLKF